MQLQVAINAPGVNHGAHYVTVEADGYQIDPKLGTLQLIRNMPAFADGPLVPMVVSVYAAGVWRTVTDVGLMMKCVADAMPQRQSEPVRENPKRRQEAGKIPAS